MRKKDLLPENAETLIEKIKKLGERVQEDPIDEAVVEEWREALTLRPGALVARDRTRERITFREGLRVIRPDGAVDVVRSCFINACLVPPLAYEAAVVLENVSWLPCSLLVAL